MPVSGYWGVYLDYLTFYIELSHSPASTSIYDMILDIYNAQYFCFDTIVANCQQSIIYISFVEWTDTVTYISICVHTIMAHKYIKLSLVEMLRYTKTLLIKERLSIKFYVAMCQQPITSIIIVIYSQM